MGIESLTQLELFDGIMGLIYPAVGIFVGILIASKYINYQRKELVLIGISLALLTIPYLAVGITFITIVFFDFPLPDNIFFLMYLGVSAFGTISWMWAMAILLAPTHIKKIVGIYSVICLTYEAYLLTMLFTNPSLIVVRVSAMNVDAVSPLVALFTLFELFSALITIIWFVKQCLRSENLRVVWKGRFLLISTIILVIATILIILNPSNIVLIAISRSLYILRLCFSYLGWILPERVAKLLVKDVEK
ncbi:MAG: hypothetical protein ACFFHV_19860 [Promethearchaeota archaeon]